MTLYAFRYALDQSVLDRGGDEAEALIEDAIFARLRHGFDSVRDAIALWRLVDPARADALAGLIDRVEEASDGPLQFEGDDLATLVQLIGGIEDAIRAAGIIDRDGRVPIERLDELKRQVPSMNLEMKRSLESKTYALIEVIANVGGLHEFLIEALRAGCIVVHD
ncbi:MAG: hypothetical protein R3B06_09270 [Kofleriaceae bacterium]